MSHDTLPRPVKTAGEPVEPPRTRRRRHWSKRPNPVAGLGSLLWLAVVIVPIYAMISASLTRQDEALGNNALKPPTDPTFANYNTVLHNGFGHFLANTALVAAAVVGIVLVLCVPLAYVAYAPGRCGRAGPSGCSCWELPSRPRRSSSRCT